MVELVLFAAMLAVIGCAPQEEGRDAVEREFAGRYRVAHDSGEVDQMMGLFWWEGVDDLTHFFVQQALIQEMDYPIASIRFESVEPGGGFDYEYEGERFRPNLLPYSRFVIEFAIEERLTSSFVLGKHGDRLFFVNSAPVKASITEGQ